MKRLSLLFLTASISVVMMGQTRFEFPKHHVADTITLGKRTHHLPSTKECPSLRAANTLKQALDSVIDTSSKTVFTYNSNGLTTQHIAYDWDSITSSWIELYKATFSYDIHGNNTQYIEYDWDSFTSSWIESYKDVNTYDIDRNKTQQIEYTWDSFTSAWIESYKYTYTYDINANITLQIDYNWDSTPSSWIALNKKESSYDINGNSTEEINYNWDDLTSTWIASWKNENTYDVNNNCTLKIEYYWDSVTSAWKNTWKYESTFDVDGNFTQEIEYNWDSVTSTWKESYKSVLVYNNSYSLNDLVLPFADENNIFKHMIVSEEDFDWDSGTSSWISKGLTNVYYSAFNVVPVNNATASTFKVSTLNGQVLISGAPVGEITTIYNLQGTAIYKQQAMAETVSVSLPAHGVYVVTIGRESVKVVN